MKKYGHPKFYKLLEEIAELHSRKSRDYAGDDPLSNLRDFGWKGVIVRLGDKWCRIKNFAEREKYEVKDESLKDTLMDNAVYSLLAWILYDDEESNKKSKSTDN